MWRGFLRAFGFSSIGERGWPKQKRATRQRRLEWDISDEWMFEESQGRKDRFNHFWAMGRSRVAFHGQLFQPLQRFELRFGPKWGTDLDTSYQQCSAYYTCCLPSFFRKLQVGNSAAWLLMCTECNPQSPEPGLSVNQWRSIYNFSPCFNIIFNISWFGKWILFHILGMSSSQLTNIFFRGVGIPPTRYPCGRSKRNYPLVNVHITIENHHS